MRKTGWVIVVFIACAGILWAQEPNAPAPQAKQPPNAPKAGDVSYARLSFLSGKAFLQRAADLGYEEVSVNMPVAEGDRLGTTDGRAEIYLAKKTYLRLDNDTKVDFSVLPKKDSSLIRLRHWAGHVYLDVAKLNKEKGIEIQTSDATFYILDQGLYRIDVKEEAQTEIMVFQGLVEASGEEGSILVKKGQRLTIANGRFDGRPSSFFAAANDGFDRWNQDRGAVVHKPYARRYLPDELEDFEGEMADYGDWRATDEFGYVWIPSNLEPGWRPYSWGRWLWMSRGWCWLPYEPWGWSTFHYGYWHWGVGLGWYWIPHNVWGPAWVNWWWDPWYYGWAPMSWWGYPGVLVNNVYYGRGWNGDYPYNSRALTVVRKDQLQAPDVRKAALNPESIKSIGKLNLAKSTLTEKPASGPRPAGASLDGGGKFILRKSGGAEGESRPASPTIERRTESSGSREIRPRGAISGYPSSSAITRGSASPSGRSLRLDSPFNRTLRYLRAPSSSSGGRSYGSPAPRSSPRTSSAPRSSPSRSGSSSGRSGGSAGGGSIRKK